MHHFSFSAAVARAAIFSAALLFFQKNAGAQPGCTDPLATNFDPAATSNDGTCQYPATTIAPQIIANLPSSVSSSSGLIFAGGRLWSHNDSDQIPQLFSIDTTTGQVLQTIDFQGLAKIDWEDLATDGQRIFIGDFGNNWSGNRTDLAIYSINIAQIKPIGDDTLAVSEVEKTSFAYPDQVDFSANGPNSTPFDCEAFFWKNGRLHLFSKNWATFVSNHYALDPVTGIVEKIEIFPAQSGLITAADIADDGSTIAMLGYDLANFTAFAWLLWDYPGEQFFSGNKRKIGLGSILTVGQAEGLAWSGGGFGGFLSNEKIQQGITIPASLWRFDWSGIFKNTGMGEADLLLKKDWKVYPNPATGVVHFQPIMGKKTVLARLFDEGGKLVLEEKTMGEIKLPAGLKTGVYLLETWSDGLRVFTKKVLIE